MKEDMSRQTTAYLTVSPKTIAPWGDRTWRISLASQLVEGGSAAYWITTPTQPAENLVSPDEIVIEQPSKEFLLDSILLMLAAHVGDDQIEGYLIDTQNLTLQDGVRKLAPFWDISAPEVRAFLARKLSEKVRLGITLLENLSLVNDEVINDLRAYGFDVDVFELTSSNPTSNS
jgi:hypothetical protein